MRPATTKSALAALAAFAALTACGGSPSEQASQTSAPATATSPATSPTTAAGGRPRTEKVSANTASKDEIIAALRAAGVSNPERWAEEVIEYRPYAADDADLTSLRENLAKYNPGQETVDKIVSALKP
ncbi:MULTISPECIES: hypothetical protein [Streptosporangium]|uniref:Pectin methylesterase-like acyl-CoA thioesterase n=1 Tax=Streptosporangium brasiliense TaxID=47480 RepID=A0ABT9R602_9ACTN|nr:hypothetical protein [Streptosporangium brasiliense]MDP9864563.1 pectin methylesterase-like acyl-CoA thioesterase [Streptosporangium brasiliense]